MGGACIMDIISYVKSKKNQYNLEYLQERTKQQYTNKIKLCTYNNYYWSESVKNIQEFLKREAIHFIGYQETNGNPEQKPEDLIPFLDYEYADYPEGTATVALMSVFDILSYDYYNITSTDKTDRWLQRIETYIHGKKASIYNTHLLADGTGVEIANQINNIINIMDADSNDYKFLVGDFNVTSNDDFDPFLTNYQLANGKNGVWIDTFKNPAYGSTQAIDNIITTKNIDILNVYRDESLTVSDHWALLSELMLLPTVKPKKVVENGLVLHLSGDTFSSSAWTDLSGMANNAEPMNFAFNNSSGYDGNGGVEFDGIDDYALVPYNSDIKPTEQITLECKIVGDISIDAEIQALINCTNSGGYSLFANLNAGNFGGYVHANGGYQVVEVPLSSIPANAHIIFTFDGRYLRLYVNGSLVNTNDLGASYPIYYNVNNGVLIGAQMTATSEASNYYYKHGMEFVRIYNRALKGDEVSQNYGLLN